MYIGYLLCMLLWMYEGNDVVASTMLHVWIRLEDEK